MCNATEMRAVDLSSSHQFEEVIGAASSENWLFIPQMEFSVQTGLLATRSPSWSGYGAVTLFAV
jgi:hypothetical protein